jgi:replicative DNA helicase
MPPASDGYSGKQDTDMGTATEIEGPPQLPALRRKGAALSASAPKLTRVPPHSIEAEQALLGCAFLAPDEILPVLMARAPSPSIFYDPRHMTIYEQMVACTKAMIPVDIVTVQQRLRDRGMLDGCGGVAYLSALWDAAHSAANYEYYLTAVLEKYALRRLLFVSSDIIGRVYDESNDATETLSGAERDILGIGIEVSRSQSDGLVDISKAQDELIVKLDRILESGRSFGLPTGYRDYDKITGGLVDGDMIVLAARPSIGKTSLAMNIVENLSVMGDVAGGVFSLEMSAESLLHRMACSMSRVPSDLFRNQGVNSKELLRYRTAHDRITKASNRLVICERGGLNMTELSAIARRMKMRFDIKYLVIDYLQLLRGSRGVSDRYEVVTEASNGVKTLAKELKIPILVLSQLNREITKQNREPRLSDLRESGCLSSSSTMLFTTAGVLGNNPSRMNTYSLSSSSRIVERVSKNIPNGTKKMVRVVLDSGRFVDCTPNHPILTDRGFVEASSLTRFHSIASVRRIPEPKAAIPIAEARWIGWMLGNGSMVGYASPSAIFSDATIADMFCAETKKHWGLTPKPHRHACKTVFQYDITAGPVRTSSGNPCKDWLRAHDLWGRRAWEKRIPDWFLESADNKSIAELVAGLIETDGSVTRNHVKYSTTSNELAWQFVWCLCRLGIFSYIDNGWMSKRAKHKCYTVRISDGRDVALLKSIVPLAGSKGLRLGNLKLSPRGSNNGDRLGNWVNEEIAKEARKASLSWSQLGYRVQGKRISQHDLQRVLDKLPELKRRLKHLVAKDVYWDRLNSIEPIDCGDVFDREVVGGPHNFVANGIVVHNSIEQDSDVVLFLHPKEQQVSSDGRESSNGQYLGGSEVESVNLIVAKQRNGPTDIAPLIFLRYITRFEARATQQEQPEATPQQESLKV